MPADGMIAATGNGSSARPGLGSSIDYQAILYGDASTRKGVYGRNWPDSVDLGGAASRAASTVWPTLKRFRAAPLTRQQGFQPRPQSPAKNDPPARHRTRSRKKRPFRLARHLSQFSGSAGAGRASPISLSHSR